MVKKLIYLVFCLFLLGGVFIRAGHCKDIYYRYPPAGASFDCRYNPPHSEMKGGVKYWCTCHGSYIKCESQESASPTMPYGGGLHPSQQMALGIFGAMLNSVFSGMFDDLIAPPRSSSNDALIRQQQEEQQRKEQEAKIAAYNKWISMQAQAEQKRLAEEKEDKKRGEEILAKASIGGGGLKMESIGGGGLAPINWDMPRLPATSAPSGQYDNSKLSEVERLLCAASFSKMGENAAKSGDLKGARFYGDQIDSVIQGLPTSIECKPSKDLASIMNMKKAGELNRKLTKQARLYQQAMPKIEKLQGLETKLEEVKKKKEDAGQKIKELDKQIEEIKARKEIADTPEKKTQEDDLLAQATALKADAEKQQKEAAESEEKLTKEKQGIEEELNKMREKMQGEK